MNLIDSYGWIEYFSGGSKATAYKGYMSGSKKLLVPTLVIYEVYKKLKQAVGEYKCLPYIAAMRKGEISHLTENLALLAADLSLKHRLHMSDSVILATALAYNATLVTSDPHFKRLSGVVII